MDERLQQAIQEQLLDGRLPCGRAHAIARKLGVEPLAVGRAADEAGIRISHCLLGLFGYGPKSEGRHKIVQPLDEVPAPLADRLRAAAESDGVTCTAVWQIAEEMGISRLEASGAVEALGLRVSRCQLGCFPRPWKG